MKDKIIETSVRLFDEKGFSETSIQEIVNEIGVTKGTFYYYFNSKEELLSMIHYDFISNLLDKQKKLMGDPTKDSNEKLRGTVSMVIKEIKKRRQSARIFFREMRHLNEKHLSNILKKRDEFRLNLQEFVDLGIQNNEIRKEFRSDILSFAILGVVNWSFFWYDPSGSVTEDELTETYVNFILNGIKND